MSDPCEGATVSMREDGLKKLLASLEEGSFFSSGRARVTRTDDGIYIEIPTNAGKHGNIEFLGIDIFIPVKAEVKLTNEQKPVEPVAEPVATDDKSDVQLPAAEVAVGGTT